MQILNHYHYSFLKKFLIFTAFEHENNSIAWPNCRTGFATALYVVESYMIVVMHDMLSSFKAWSHGSTTNNAFGVATAHPNDAFCVRIK